MPLPDIKAMLAPKSMVKSWKTTLAGAVAALGEYLSKPDQEPVVQTIGTIMVYAGLVMVGIFARDSNVSSESAGAKPADQPPT